MDFSRILSHCRNTGKTHKINQAVSVVTFTDCVCIPSAPRALYIFQLCRRAAGLLRSLAAVGLGAGAASPFTLPFLKGCRVLPRRYRRRPTCVIALCRALRRRDRSPVCCRSASPRATPGGLCSAAALLRAGAPVALGYVAAGLEAVPPWGYAGIGCRAGDVLQRRNRQKGFPGIRLSCKR